MAFANGQPADGIAIKAGFLEAAGGFGAQALIQPALLDAEQGGDFEYAPGIRAEDENFAEVSKSS